MLLELSKELSELLENEHPFNNEAVKMAVIREAEILRLLMVLGLDQ
jgi:hypothetical protein